MKSVLRRYPRLIPIVGWVVIVFWIYIVMLALNFTLSRVQLYYPEVSEAQEIENTRIEEEDNKQIESALAQGYSRLMLPFVLDDSAHKIATKALMQKMGVGLIGGQPYTNIFWCNEGYGLVKYKTDRFGLRNNDEYWDKLDALEVLLIGDSFAHGACVEYKYTIGEYLVASGFNTLNLASASNGPQNYAFLSNVFTKITVPKFVVNVLYSNDNYSEEMRERIAKGIYYNTVMHGDRSRGMVKKYGASLHPSSEYISAVWQYHGHLIDSLNTKKFEEGFLNKLLKSDYWLLKHIRYKFKEVFDRAADKLIEGDLDYLSKLAVDTIVHDCREVGCRPIFVYIPNSEFFRPDPYAKKYSEKLKKYVGRLNVIFLDTTSELQKLGVAAYAIKGQHLSPLGYEVVSRLIISEIKKDNLY